MTTDTTERSHVSKFQNLLRELFQFDCADLDFGIYRIMNHKRGVVETFITEKLPERVDAALSKGAAVEQSQAAERLEEVVAKVRSLLGDDAIGADGELAQIYRERPIGLEYAQARSAAEGAHGRDTVETAIYNHLYTFFSRYYEDGDFISKRRYGRNQRYAIPYNGEEVYLHWANSDQYYVKTDEHFRDYDWQAPNGVAVRFRLTDADVEQNNVKGDKRFFLPRAGETRWDADERAVTIPFEFRPLTAAEARRYSSRLQQDKIIAEAASAIPERLDAAAEALEALTGEQRQGDADPVSRLEHHLRRYARKNDSDFFIHKDLTGFLTRELDFYLKNEVLSVDDLLAAGERLAEGRFQQMQVIRQVGAHIIEFLAQIEDFQKMLWEKRKFVTETHYCVTLSEVDAEFYAEIAANDAQWEEWREVFDADGSDRGADFLRANPTLVLDTRHFSADFTDRLLASFDDLDGMTDGLLVHSENWQALRLLEEKYRQGVKCIYIDPPYNTAATEILYKNGYKHSSYLSLIHDRILLGKGYMNDNTVHVVAIDENEFERVSTLLKTTFSDKSHTAVSIVHNPTGQQGQNFSYSHDFACFSYNPVGGRQIGQEVREGEGILSNFRDWGGQESRREVARNCFYPVYIKDGEIISFGDVCEPSYHPASANMPMEDGSVAVFPIDPEDVERKWRFSRLTVGGIAEELFPHFVKSRKVWDIRRRKNTFNFKTVWSASKYSANNHGTQLLNHMFGTQQFDFPKSLYTVTDCLRACRCEPDSLVLDYFAGSGTTAHAAINLNREDGGQRRFILVEMGDYFDTVLLPRVKKVIHSPEWTNGKPKRKATVEEAQRSPRIVKYMRIESYEDALDGIEFGEATGQLNLEDRLGDGYLLKYMLKWETKDSQTLLNVTDLDSPFDYRLRSHANGTDRERLADVPETFNYLLGLNVRTRHVYHDGERRYLVYRGETREAPGRETVVIWRDARGWSEQDHQRDRRFVAEQGLVPNGATVYVNQPSSIAGAKPVEPLFHARMFAGVNG